MSFDGTGISEQHKRAAAGHPAEIRVVGLGPGDWSQLTIGTLDQLLATRDIYFRTLVHPVVEPLRQRLGAGQRLHSFDELYERASTFDDLYQTIVDRLIDAARESGEPILYAVPGHPHFGERTVALLLAAAPGHDVRVQVFDAVSFVEPVATTLGIDPLSGSLALLDGAALLQPTESLTDPWVGLSPRLHTTGRPLLIGQVYDRRVASAAKLWLLDRYPAEHPATVVTAAGTAEQNVRGMPLAELDHSAAFDHLTSIYVPPLEPIDDVRSLGSLAHIAARLRAPDGCPWDREQTIESLKPHLLEEAHEVVAALDHADLDGAVEELGDVLLLITMIAQIGEEAGDFDYPAVLETATKKLIRRHPHVFGEQKWATAEAVLQNWERLKASEREETASALSGVPVSMPSVIASQVMQRKAAALGFDWPDVEGVYAKVQEEIQELQEATPETALEEAGDVLFALVSLCRHLKVDADEALRKANAKFRRRFEQVEARCLAASAELSKLTPAELDELWNDVKRAERESMPAT